VSFAHGLLLNPTIERLYIVPVGAAFQFVRVVGMRPMHNDIIAVDTRYDADLILCAALYGGLHSRLDFGFAAHVSAALAPGRFKNIWGRV
jgi:hypothetical protein